MPAKPTPRPYGAPARARSPSQRAAAAESPAAAAGGGVPPGLQPASGDGEARRRAAGDVDLGAYEKPAIPGNRNLVWRTAWYLANALLFQSALPGLIPSAWKALLLRAFGARVGRGLVCKPRVTIKYPWFLELGDHVWLGEMVWIDNHCPVTVGSNVCISQGAYLFTGNHDYDDPRFRFFSRPIRIGDGAWVGARAVVCPGSEVGRMAVLGAGVVWRGEAAPYAVHVADDPRARGPTEPPGRTRA
jgi:putative colanic acid biosynthesis acetyltransferase WcaF